MEMTKKQREAFGAKRGAFSIVTGREDFDGQLTFDKSEKKIFFSRQPKPQVFRGKIQGNEHQAGQSVMLYDGLDEKGMQAVYVNHPKKKGNEIRLYFRANGFNPRAHDVWFIIIRQHDDAIGIGSCDIDEFLAATGALPLLTGEAASAGGTPAAPVPRAKREINARRGQSAFRRALLKKFDRTCCVTGSRVMDVLEAAHISTIPGMDDNRPENGLLLRSDVHTLHDLGLLAIHPANFDINIVEALKGSEYKRYLGKPLRAPADVIDQIDHDSLRERWRRFQLVEALFKES